jgi:hypothetical protein
MRIHVNLQMAKAIEKFGATLTLPIGNAICMNKLHNSHFKQKFGCKKDKSSSLGDDKIRKKCT